MEKILSLALLIFSPLVFTKNQTLNTQGIASSDYLLNPVKIETQTRFSEKEITTTKALPYPTEYQDDSNLEIGEKRIIQKGEEGTLTQIYKVTFWDDTEVEKELIKELETPPQKEVVALGTKIIWRKIETGDFGTLDYWRKLNVWATSYDGKCKGCRGLTFSGTPVKHGVCAVDSKVIPLGTNFYVPGYGMCRAEDTGGRIKGNKVDLGFEDVKNGWWRSCYADTYLLTNPSRPGLD